MDDFPAFNCGHLAMSTCDSGSLVSLSPLARLAHLSRCVRPVVIRWVGLV